MGQKFLDVRDRRLNGKKEKEKKIPSFRDAWGIKLFQPVFAAKRISARARVCCRRGWKKDTRGRRVLICLIALVRGSVIRRGAAAASRGIFANGKCRSHHVRKMADEAWLSYVAQFHRRVEFPTDRTISIERWRGTCRLRDIYGTFESGERKMGSRDRVARETGCVVSRQSDGRSTMRRRRERERERVSEWGWAAARSRGTRGGGVAFWHDMCRSSLARDLRLDWLPLIRESGLLMRGEFRDYKYQRYREPGPRGRLDSKWNRRRSRGLPRPQKQLRQTDSRVLCSLSPRVYATIRFKPR